MGQRKKTFKERIRQNDLKQRHKFSSQLRDRMGAARRRHNRYDRIDSGSRPLDDIVEEISSGLAIPMQEMNLDARGLTDLLLSLNYQKPESVGGGSGGGALSGAASSSSTVRGEERRGRPPTSSSSPDAGDNDGGEAAAALGTTSSSSSIRRTGGSGHRAPNAAPITKLSDAPLPADHPLALPDTKALEEAEAEARRKAEEEVQQRNNRNQYRHHGQPHVFWERCGLHPLLLQALRRMKFTHPTPTQEEVLPTVLEAAAARQRRWEKEQLDAKMGKSGDGGRKKLAGLQDKDVLVSAETGSGKTLVFALPILQELMTTVYGESVPPSTGGCEDIPQKTGKKRSREECDKPSSSSSSLCKDKESAAKVPASGQEEEQHVKNKHKRMKKKKGDTAAASNPMLEEDEQQEEELREKAKTEQDSNKATRLMHSLILSPTRELALQILHILRQLTQDAPRVRVGCVVGGMASEKQQRVLNQHPHILICTPGRLWELVQKNEGCYLGHSISRRLRYVVLDEADRMLYAGKSFDELKQLLARIHCEVLPAGFVQEREEGAEAGEHTELEAGKWDETLQRFVSFKEAEERLKKAKNTKKDARRNEEENDDDEEEEEAKETNKNTNNNKKKMPTKAEGKKNKKNAKKRKDDEDKEEEEEEGYISDAMKKELEKYNNEDEEEDEDEEEEVSAGSAVVTKRRKKKDEPQPMAMPPDPPAHHRVVTVVTSATLALQTKYERRDFSAQKSIIRTTNADVMGKVLQELSIKSSNALVFNVAASSSGVAATINETYLRCPDESKDLYMYYFLKTYAKKERTIIFVNAISMLRRLVKIIEILGIGVVGLHASMQQRQRLKFIDRFKRGDITVLVATDVASRGLDIDDVRYVLHFQVPRSTDSYIHRCGRTARCGATGLSLVLVNAQEHVSFRKLLESTGRKESDLETFALQPTVVHQLHAHLRIALQIDKLTKEINKSRAKNTWVSRMSKQAEIDADDMIDDEADEENRQKGIAIKALSRELKLQQQKFTGAGGGKGAFRTGSHALGARLAEEKLTQRAQRQTFLVKQKKKQ